ncbi:piccolo-like protein [Sarcoptes scabiei]|nr:piccolo-like protein [Sarcoptes scabiei]
MRENLRDEIENKDKTMAAPELICGKKKCFFFFILNSKSKDRLGLVKLNVWMCALLCLVSKRKDKIEAEYWEIHNENSNLRDFITNFYKVYFCGSEMKVSR